MSTEVAAAPAQPAKAKKPRSTGPKKPKVAASHPPVADMVRAAITSLKERNGSSSQAIRKYIASSYKVDVDRLIPHIRRYLKSGVTKGALVQTKGKGAAGSFKLAAAAAKKVVKKPKTTKPKTPKKPKAPKAASGEKKASKPKAAKKSPAKKTKTAKKSPAKPKAVKSKVEKKPKTVKAAKPKTPKKPKAAAKKPAAKKTTAAAPVKN